MCFFSLSQPAIYLDRRSYYANHISRYGLQIFRPKLSSRKKNLRAIEQKKTHRANVRPSIWREAETKKKTQSREMQIFICWSTAPHNCCGEFSHLSICSACHWDDFIKKRQRHLSVGLFLEVERRGFAQYIFLQIGLHLKWPKRRQSEGRHPIDKRD